jgi:hypothetical protein
MAASDDASGKKAAHPPDLSPSSDEGLGGVPPTASDDFQAPTRFVMPPGDLGAAAGFENDETRLTMRGDLVAASSRTVAPGAELDLPSLPPGGPADLPPLPGDAPVAETTSELPAHLQLPSIDFSLPPGTGLGASSGSDASSRNAELPAHLQLPSFPELGLPGGGPELGASSAGAGAWQDLPGDLAPPLTPPPVPAAPRKSDAGRPPPPPPSRPRGRHAAEEAPPPALDFFGMPNLDLPDLAPPPPKKNLTLVSTPISSDDETLKPARVVWPFVLVGVLACAAVGLFMAREPLLALVAPKQTSAPVAAPSPQAQAKVAFAEGVRSYGTKDFGKAIGAFEQALSLDPTLADAHRSLGIVYATTKEQAKAVDHYQRYLALSPAAPDAVEVQKIVDDYAKAQAPAAAEAPPKAEATAAMKSKKVKGKKGKR